MKTNTQPNPLHVQLIRANTASFLDTKSLARVASTNKAMHQTTLHMKTQDLIDLLQTVSHVPKDKLDKAKEVFNEQKNQNSHSTLLSRVTQFFSINKKSSISQTFYRQLLSMFQPVLLHQVSVSACSQGLHTNKINSDEMKYTFSSTLPLNQIKRYVTHLCAANAEIAGRLLAKITEEIKPLTNEAKLRSETIALMLIDQGADMKVALKKNVLMSCVSYHKPQVLKTFLDCKQVNIDLKLVELLLLVALNRRYFDIADLLLRYFPALNVVNVLPHLILSEATHGGYCFNHQLISFLFKLGVTPLDFAIKTDDFINAIVGICNENEYASHRQALINLAKNQEHKIAVTDVMRALFSDTSSLSTQFISELNTSSAPNSCHVEKLLEKLHRNLINNTRSHFSKIDTLYYDAGRLKNRIKFEEGSQKIGVAKAILQLYKIAERMEHKKHDVIDRKHVL